MHFSNWPELSIPTASTAIYASIAVIFAISVISCFVYFKWRYKRLQATTQRLIELGLMENRRSSLLVVDDKWELHRDQIVINRKLGEGAFGTVYGGEAQLQGAGWEAVAIKTLKPDCKPEEKVDFLGEAETMKRFQHSNIVRLIGVITRGEPIYMIMEFMMFGDLKTFLLARRNMVLQKSSDVSAKAITKFALDVATGLQYLGSLNYIHRDLACRNCMVDYDKTVKIGDFGMARAMYSHDYYRFSRKSMLPVRWMAPESLTDGIFTYKTDVFGFGVLVYEIMTFGSFPHQGLNNIQVVEIVVRGARTKLPEDCAQPIRGVITECWSADPAQRPSADALVQFLQRTPEAVRPCIMAPSYSVENESVKVGGRVGDSNVVEIAAQPPALLPPLRLGGDGDARGGSSPLLGALEVDSVLRRTSLDVTALRLRNSRLSASMDAGQRGGRRRASCVARRTRFVSTLDLAAGVVGGGGGLGRKEACSTGGAGHDHSDYGGSSGAVADLASVSTSV